MNYLCHVWLARDYEPQVILGNLVGDWIKGSRLEEWPEQLIQGVRMHRLVDQLTDDITSQYMGIFPQGVRRFGGIALDVFWDHCLSLHWDELGKVENLTQNERSTKQHLQQSMLRQKSQQKPLQQFVPDLMKAFDKEKHVLTPQFRKRLFWIRNNRLLLSYQKWEGVLQSLNHVSSRLRVPDRLPEAADIIRNNQTELEEKFLDFVPQIQSELWSQFSVNPANPH